MKKLVLAFTASMVCFISSAANAASVVDFGSKSWSFSGASRASLGTVSDALTSTATGTLALTITNGDFDDALGETIKVYLKAGDSTDPIDLPSLFTAANLIGEKGNFTQSVITFGVDYSILQTLLTGSEVTFGFKNSALVGGPGSIAATLTYNTVPEPTTLAIIGLGALGAVAARRRRK